MPHRMKWKITGPWYVRLTWRFTRDGRRNLRAARSLENDAEFLAALKAHTDKLKES